MLFEVSSSDLRPYISINFQEKILVTEIHTKAHNYAYVTEYTVAYHTGINNWIALTDENNNILHFSANTDDENIAINKINIPVYIEQIRIYPLKYITDLCMKFEIYGFTLWKNKNEIVDNNSEQENKSITVSCILFDQSMVEFSIAVCL